MQKATNDYNDKATEVLTPRVTTTVEEVAEETTPVVHAPVQKENLVNVTETRRARRAKARKTGAAFVPVYNVRNAVKTYEEFHGVGNERFNDKFVTIKEIEAEETK